MRFVFPFLCLLYVVPALAQPARAWEKAGDQAVREADWYTAQYYYSQALLQHPDDPLLLWKQAEVLRQRLAWESAARMYERLLDLDPDRFPLARLHLADMYRRLGRYDDAIAHFEAFIEAGRGGVRWLDQARQLAESCRQAQRMAAQPDTTWTIRPLGRAVNTGWNEFAPWQAGDTLFFSSNRYLWRNDTARPPRRLSRLYFAIGDGRARPLPARLQEKDAHTAHLVPAGDTLFYTRCRFVRGSRIRCQLMIRTRDRHGRWSRHGQPLPPPVNIEGCTTTQPAIGFDSTTHTRWLFFASDRAGGQGGLDLWAVPLFGDSLGPLRNLEALNTPYDEGTPFFHAPSQTLWFASNRPEAMGGWDIFYSPWPPDSLGPRHPAPPINSSFNDLYFFLSENGTRAWLASNRPGSRYLDEDSKHCCNDLFELRRHLPKGERNHAPDSAAIAAAPADTAAQAPPPTLPEFLPLALYFDNDMPDPRSRSDTTGVAYLETCAPYQARKAEYAAVLSQGLDSRSADSVRQAVNAFFEEVDRGCAWLEAFSELLLRRLERGDTVELRIRGYTSPRAESDYNLLLAARRIASVRNHFANWRQGALKPWLDAGLLKISELPLGETQSSGRISDRLDDLRGSVYSLEASRERKVVIEEIRQRRQ